MSGNLTFKTVKILYLMLMIAYTNSVYSQNILRYTRDKDFTIETLPSLEKRKLRIQDLTKLFQTDYCSYYKKRLQATFRKKGST